MKMPPRVTTTRCRRLALCGALALGAAGCGSTATKGAGATPSTASTVAVSARSSTSLGTTPAGAAVPVNFEATSATFVTGQDGWVLGTAPCTSGPCTALVRTTDGGASWVGVPAPRDALAPDELGASGVSYVRFADASDGWVFGPDLWSTHDGGATWSSVSLGRAGAQVQALATAGGRVHAVVSFGCTPFQAGVCTEELYSSPVDADDFSADPGLTLTGVVTEADLELQGAGGYLVQSGRSGSQPASILWRSTDGVEWTRGPPVCSTETDGGISLAPLTTTMAFLLCGGPSVAQSTAKTIYRSDDGGATFDQVAGSGLPTGNTGYLAAATPSDLALAAASGDSDIFRSTDGGATWTSALQLTGGAWGDFGFTDASHGWALHDPASMFAGSKPSTPPYGPDPGTLFLTSDGGATWHPVPITASSPAP